MTAEERFQYIEHIMAGIAEDRKSDREEYRQLWRDHEREMAELRATMKDHEARLERTRALLEASIIENDSRHQETQRHFREFERSLDERIGTLVSAIARAFPHS